MKRTFLKKVSPKALEKQLKKKEETKILHQFMKDWWSSFGDYKRCMACNCYLPREFSTANVDHLISKSKYPQFVLDVRNFFLCCLNCHHSKEMGFPLPKHKEAIDKIKLELL